MEEKESYITFIARGIMVLGKRMCQKYFKF